MPRTRHPGYCKQQKSHHGNKNLKSFWLNLLIKLLCTTFDTHSDTILLLFVCFFNIPIFACSISKHFSKKPLSYCVVIKQRQLRDPDLHNNHKYSYANNWLHVSVTKHNVDSKATSMNQVIGVPHISWKRNRNTRHQCKMFPSHTYSSHPKLLLEFYYNSFN